VLFATQPLVGLQLSRQRRRLATHLPEALNFSYSGCQTLKRDLVPATFREWVQKSASVNGVTLHTTVILLYIPLPTPTSPGREFTHQDNPWEGQPCRYSDETLANELSEWLEGAMDVDFAPILDIPILDSVGIRRGCLSGGMAGLNWPVCGWV